MMSAGLRNDERIGLGVAVVAHLALVAVLLWQPQSTPVVTPPDRIEVTINTDASLISTSPDPMSDARSDEGPELGEPAPAAAPAAAPAPAPKAAAEPETPAEQEPPPPAKTPPPVAKARPEPAPRPVAKPRPAPTPVRKPAPRPTPRPAPAARPAPKAPPPKQPAPRPAPAARPAPKAPARPAARPAPARPAAAARPAAKSGPANKAGTGTSNAAAATRPSARPGASRIGNDFLAGVPGARSTSAAQNPPAAAAGPAVRASLLGAISRAIKPHWQGKVPEGPDSDKLVTVLQWNLNRNGTLAGAPTVVNQTGINDANRPQAARHAEQAIRAVQLAAPFDLPDQYYDNWKRVTIRFDKRLSQ